MLNQDCVWKKGLSVVAMAMAAAMLFEMLGKHAWLIDEIWYWGWLWDSQGVSIHTKNTLQQGSVAALWEAEILVLFSFTGSFLIGVTDGLRFFLPNWSIPDPSYYGGRKTPHIYLYTFISIHLYIYIYVHFFILSLVWTRFIMYIVSSIPSH